jgi:hypothetical protein
VSRSCQSVRTVSTHDASRGGSAKRRRARCAVVTTVWVCRLEVPLNEQLELEYQARIVLLLGAFGFMLLLVIIVVHKELV